MSNSDLTLGGLVVAVFTDGRIRDIGTAISYSTEPTYEIERTDGSRFSSNASLTRAIRADEEATYWRRRAEAAESKLNAKGGITINKPLTADDVLRNIADSFQIASNRRSS